jgi:hypothetical protein
MGAASPGCAYCPRGAVWAMIIKRSPGCSGRAMALFVAAPGDGRFPPGSEDSWDNSTIGSCPRRRILGTPAMAPTVIQAPMVAAAVACRHCRRGATGEPTDGSGEPTDPKTDPASDHPDTEPRPQHPHQGAMDHRARPVRLVGHRGRDETPEKHRRTGGIRIGFSQSLTIHHHIIYSSYVKLHMSKIVNLRRCVLRWCAPLRAFRDPPQVMVAASGEASALHGRRLPSRPQQDGCGGAPLVSPPRSP